MTAAGLAYTTNVTNIAITALLVALGATDDEITAVFDRYNGRTLPEEPAEACSTVRHWLAAVRAHAKGQTDTPPTEE